MKILPITDKELFLRYAIPCGEVLVNRGSLDARLLKKAEKIVTDGKAANINPEKMFPTAAKMCTLIARKMGKKEVDAQVIRRYFLFEHEKAVRWRMRIYPDVAPEKCIVFPARVLRSGELLLVNTPSGKKILDTRFAPEVKRGDWVATHYSYASEKIPSETAKRMMRKRLIRSKGIE
jgi:hydrogenase maturation factor